MQRIRVHAAMLAAMLCALPGGFAGAETMRRGGYAVGAETCGEAPHAFPRLRIGLRNGYCAGLVASAEDGLQFPRSIIQLPGRDLFVVADMGGWSRSKGRLLLLDPQLPPGRRTRVLLDGLDYPFGLVIGRDNKLYSSTSETIFRFEPLASEPARTVETIVRGLPARNIRLPDGSKVSESAHLMKPFVLDAESRLYVNVGAPTDACVGKRAAANGCAAGEGPMPLAAIWAFTPPPGGVFPALQPGDANPPMEAFARGLRNSMALTMHPRFPAEGFAFLQAENARDLSDPMRPNEELNALDRGKHYGWPYCYDLATASPEFKAFLQTNAAYKDFCNNKAAYRQPYSLLPPHSAPLAMLYYRGNRLAELDGKLVVGLHGYRPTGSRVIFYDVDATGFPAISPAPVRYNVSCAAEPSRPFQTDKEPQVPAAAFTELISQWHRVNGVRPQGAPVGMTVAADGSLWLVEDKNATVIRIDAAPGLQTEELPCGARTDRQIDRLIAYVRANDTNRRRLRQMRTQLVEKHCAGCHSDFNLRPEQSDDQRDDAVLRFALAQDGWIYPGDPDAGRLRTRLRGLGSEKVMPANGRELIAKDRAYRELLAAIDQLVGTMVPGQRMRVRPGRVDRRFYDKSGKICGAIPTNTVVVVIEKPAREKPGFNRIYRPADIYLNGECTDDGGYYLEQRNVAPL
ncbi:MAG: PQQ-dependent sugar dehydrogenase [Xanthobacteraceae bacterium]|nr:PQQ-dependent sugar dehydrogenase [Xanthobacteraceae bacterium]